MQPLLRWYITLRYRRYITNRYKRYIYPAIIKSCDRQVTRQGWGEHLYPGTDDLVLEDQCCLKYFRRSFRQHPYGRQPVAIGKTNGLYSGTSGYVMFFHSGKGDQSFCRALYLTFHSLQFVAVLYFSMDADGTYITLALSPMKVSSIPGGVEGRTVTCLR